MLTSCRTCAELLVTPDHLLFTRMPCPTCGDPWPRSLGVRASETGGPA